MGNPYTIGFGIKPVQYIPRTIQREEIIAAFHNDTAVTPAYIVTGVRGSGKTVMLDEISAKMGEEWIVINLNSYAPLLQSFVSKLYYHPEFRRKQTKKSLSISVAGVTAGIEENAPEPENETLAEELLREVKKSSRKVLVVIDEVENSENMRSFAASFQILIREGLPVWLLMAGLPENIYGLSEGKKSTFLIRTPKVIMEPLNFGMIRSAYIRNLKVEPKTAAFLAKLTKGYSFAYQTLGHICWGKKIDIHTEAFEDILLEYDYYLQEYSYKKIWESLSPTDRKIAAVIAESDNGIKVKELREKLNMAANYFTVYRNRLKQRELLDTTRYGEVAFSLPRFAEFIRMTTAEQEI